MIPRRTLMTADAVGGVWTYALDLARGLTGSGVEVSLAVLGPDPSPDQIVEARAMEGLAVIETGLPLDWTASGPAALRRSADAIRALASDVRADLVHLNSPALAADGEFAAPTLGVCHSCLATWWSAVKGGEAPADFRWRTAALRRGLAACDALAAPSHSFAEAIARTYDLPRPAVIYNGRNPPQPGAEMREPMVFTCGRLWDEGKNAAVLDAAAALTRAPIYAAGPLSGPGGASFDPRFLRSLGGLSSAQVAQWLPRAAIFASSARYEPFGLGVLEAAQAGCALVLADIPTFRELWEDAALFVAPDSPQGFAAAFDALLADTPRAGRLAKRAKARARRFTVEAMSAGVLALYRDLCGGLARPRRREAAA